MKKNKLNLLLVTLAFAFLSFSAFAAGKKVKPLHNVQNVDPANGIWRGSQPDSKKDYDFIQNEIGAKTVISLRWEEDVIEKERIELEARGMN